MQLWLIALSEVGYKIPQNSQGSSVDNILSPTQEKSASLNFAVGKGIAAPTSHEQPTSCSDVEKHRKEFWTAGWQFNQVPKSVRVWQYFQITFQNTSQEDPD